MNDNISRHSTTYDSETIDYLKKELLISISSILQEIVEEQHEFKETRRTIFYSKTVPGISIESYLDRMIKYTKMETSTLILILIYIDRICEYNSLVITRFNVHRLLLAAMIVSIKVNEDDFYSNSFYSKVGGVSLEEINNLENEFLKLIRYRLWTDYNLFNKYKVNLMKYDKL
jgi:hypothetical protein